LNDKNFLERAVELAAIHSENGKNGPFGAVVVKSGKIIAEGWNRVTECSDPSAHAEIVAIRKACEILETHILEDCTIYTSCEPCPMCFSAIIWSRIERVVFAETRHGAAKAGFDDHLIYEAINSGENQNIVVCEHHAMHEARKVFDDWITNENKEAY